ncbi:hypothetical protein ACSSS7_004879 [Eimeria intestinalis]
MDPPQGNVKKTKGVKKGFMPTKKKNRKWFQPKDKSLTRKKFIKVRDARARSEFSKLQKRRGTRAAAAAATAAGAAAGAADSKDSFLPLICSGDADNDDFLQRLMDPFARPNSKTHAPASDGDESSEEEQQIGSRKGKRKKIRGREGSDASEVAACTDPASVTSRHATPREIDEKKANEDRASSTVLKSNEEGFKGVKKKGYMPFLKAREAFEAKQREKLAARRAREEEVQKNILKRREKKRLDKFAHRKLQARTKKGQMVMGNVMDVLLLKMQRNAQK